MGIFNADVIINIPPAFFSLQKSGLVRVYLTSVSFFFLFLDVSVTKSLNLIPWHYIACGVDATPVFCLVCAL